LSIVKLYPCLCKISDLVPSLSFLVH
jgi:hypothetical protein